jgi:hypothetical protein
MSYSIAGGGFQRNAWITAYPGIHLDRWLVDVRTEETRVAVNLQLKDVTSQVVDLISLVQNGAGSELRALILAWRGRSGSLIVSLWKSCARSELPKGQYLVHSSSMSDGSSPLPPKKPKTPYSPSRNFDAGHLSGVRCLDESHSGILGCLGFDSWPFFLEVTVSAYSLPVDFLQGHLHSILSVLLPVCKQRHRLRGPPCD